MEKEEIHIEKVEEKALNNMVEVGLFASRDEAARAAILKYAMDMGALSRQAIWQIMEKTKKRKVTSEQLAKDLETLEDEN